MLWIKRLCVKFPTLNHLNAIFNFFQSVWTYSHNLSISDVYSYIHLSLLFPYQLPLVSRAHRKGKHSCSALKKINVCSHSCWHCVYLVWCATQHIFQKWRKWKVNCTPRPSCMQTGIFSERNEDDDVFGGSHFNPYCHCLKRQKNCKWQEAFEQRANIGFKLSFLLCSNSVFQWTSKKCHLMSCYVFFQLY